MINKGFTVVTIFFCIGMFSFNFAESSKNTAMSFEEFQTLQKKEKEKKTVKANEEDYKEYLEFQEYKKKKAEGNQVEELKKKQKADKITYPSWTFYYLGASGIAKGNNVQDGRTSQFQLGAEYHLPESRFNFRLELSSWSYTYKKTPQKFINNLVLIELIQLMNLNLFPILSELPSDKSIKSVTGTDFTGVYHFRPRTFIDPYLIAGFGIGVCGKQCNAMRVLVGSGINIDIKEGYFFSEVFLEKPYFKYYGEDGTTPNFYSRGIRFGIAVFL